MSHQAAYSINVDSAIAVYVQIENQVEFAIASGRIKAGDTLPSVREMSSMLNINPNTVTKAYRDLEIRKIVHPRRGVGVIVTEAAFKACRDSVLDTVKNHLVEAVAECVSVGLPSVDIRKLVTQTIDSGVAPYRSGK